MTLVMSQLKLSDFLIIWTRTLAPFAEILAPFGPILAEMVSMDLKPCLYVFNFSTCTWCWVHYTRKIILQPFLVFVNIPSFVSIFSHTPFNVDTTNSPLEDDIGQRYFAAPAVADNKRASIPLDGCDLCSTKLLHHPSWFVGPQSSYAMKD